MTPRKKIWRIEVRQHPLYPGCWGAVLCVNQPPFSQEFHVGAQTYPTQEEAQFIVKQLTFALDCIEDDAVGDLN